jgi:hypothetical protein
MPSRRPPPNAPDVTPDDPAEYQRFLDIAHEVGADEDPEALDRAFEKVISRTPNSPTSRRKGKDAP